MAQSSTGKPQPQRGRAVLLQVGFAQAYHVMASSYQVLQYFHHITIFCMSPGFNI